MSSGANARFSPLILDRFERVPPDCPIPDPAHSPDWMSRYVVTPNQCGQKLGRQYLT